MYSNSNLSKFSLVYFAFILYAYYYYWNLIYCSVVYSRSQIHFLHEPKIAHSGKQYILPFIYLQLKVNLKNRLKTTITDSSLINSFLSLIREQIERYLLLLHESESNCKPQSDFDFWWVPDQLGKPLQQIVRNFHGSSDQDVCFRIHGQFTVMPEDSISCMLFKQYCLCQFTLQC